MTMGVGSGSALAILKYRSILENKPPQERSAKRLERQAIPSQGCSNGVFKSFLSR